MTVSPPGHWLLNRMVFLLNRTLGIINTAVENGLVFLLQNSNTFTGVNTFMGGIKVNNIDSINGNTTFNSEIIVNSNITANNGSFIGDNLVINTIENNTNSNISFQSSINMNSNDITNITSLSSSVLTATDLNIGNISTNTAANISVLNTIDMNNNYIINANIAALNHSQISVENGLINARILTLDGFDVHQTNGVTFRAWHGLNPLKNTKVVLHPSDTLYLPENNGVQFGTDNSNHTQSIIGIGGLSKVQNNTQQFINSQCYLIPPSMVLHKNDLQGIKLFETIGESTSIKHLAGYPTANVEINELRNTLVPTVGQIVDLLNYLGVSMDDSKADNLKSTY